VGKRGFSAVERWAVYTVHGEKCYMCPKPLDLRSMQVDHIVPESLLGEPEALARVLKSLGLPSDFEINDYGNWLPAHSDCNNFKRATPFEPSPLIQMLLQKTKEKAERVAELAQRTVSNHRLMLALNAIEQAMEDADIDSAILEPVIQSLIKVRDYHFRSASREEVELFEQETRRGVVFNEPPLDFSHIDIKVATSQISPEHTELYFGPRYVQLDPIHINAKTVVSLTAVMTPASRYLNREFF
jgi:hypothetical protein